MARLLAWIPFLFLVTPFVVQAEPSTFNGENRIGRTLVTKGKRSRTLFGYFCQQRTPDASGVPGCTAMQFATSPEPSNVAHDMTGKPIGEGEKWSPVGPLLSPESAEAFATKMRSTPETAALFEQIWEEGIWDQSDDNWQLEPRPISAKTLNAFLAFLQPAEKEAATIATEVERAKNAQAARQAFVGWWLEEGRYPRFHGQNLFHIKLGKDERLELTKLELFSGWHSNVGRMAATVLVRAKESDGSLALNSEADEVSAELSFRGRNYDEKVSMYNPDDLVRLTSKENYSYKLRKVQDEEVHKRLRKRYRK